MSFIMNRNIKQKGVFSNGNVHLPSYDPLKYGVPVKRLFSATHRSRISKLEFALAEKEFMNQSLKSLLRGEQKALFFKLQHQLSREAPRVGEYIELLPLNSNDEPISGIVKTSKTFRGRSVGLAILN